MNECEQLLNDYLQSRCASGAPEPEEDYRRLQRAGLAEALHLSKAQAGPVEAQLDDWCKQRTAHLQQKREKQLAEIDEAHAQQLEQAQTEFARQLEEIDQRHQVELKKVKTKGGHSWQEVQGQADGLEQDAHKRCEYDVLMAETFADGQVRRYRQRGLVADKACQNAQARLEERREIAQHLTRRYHCTWPSEAPAPQDEPQPSRPSASYHQQWRRMETLLGKLDRCFVGRLFAGMTPWVLSFLAILLSVGAAGILFFSHREQLPSFAVCAGIAAGAALVVVIVAGRLLFGLARRNVGELATVLNQTLSAAHVSLAGRCDGLKKLLELRGRQVVQKRDADVELSRHNLDNALKEVHRRRDATLGHIEMEARKRRDAIRHAFHEEQQQCEQQREARLAEIHQTHKQQREKVTQECDTAMAAAGQQYKASQAALQQHYQEGWACVAALLRQTQSLLPTETATWTDPLWRDWTPPEASSAWIRFGQLRLDNAQPAAGVSGAAGGGADDLHIPDMPAMLAFPDRCSLLLETDHEGRETGLNILQAVMTRLMACIRPGQVRFTILDPVGLGENFAGFMHASDYDEALVGRRIWTDAGHIQQQLIDLTDHMENVIQKYLRNEYETIEQYNRQAGELAEPYRFLVIADFPTNFNEESARRLRSIINSGARCGVYTLILRDTRHDLPLGIKAEDLASQGARLKWRKGAFAWEDEVFGQFTLETDAPPDEQLLTAIMHKVGKKSRDVGRVEVPFEVIAPDEDNVWSLDSSNDLHVPLGRTGATRLQSLRLGYGVAQHTLIAGKTGSGKSTLLHVIITNLALWYSPREVEMYLIDFKRGVEFKTYVTAHLPHARAIAVESDREFGLSVLQRLDAEMARRGELFRQAGVQDLAGYRRATGEILPRTILIVDEFQVFFTEDDKLAQDAAGLLEQLVRQGRAFGVHVLLGSQTLSGASGLARSTLGQMAVRIALQCSETDSHLILDDDNPAARLLNRPGEAIYNDTGGRPESNSPFQISWLNEDQRDIYLGRLRKRCEQIEYTPPRPAIFEGNVPAQLTDNYELENCWQEPAKRVELPRMWLGEPVAIKEPTHIILRDQSGAQILMIGQQPAAAMGITHSMLASLTAQQSPRDLRIIMLDGTPADAPFAGRLEQWLKGIPHPTEVYGVKDVTAPLNELSELLQQRHENAPPTPRIYLVVFGLQRFRDLRRSEDDFSFSLDAEPAAPKPGKQFIEIIREGPAAGIHTIIWADSMAGLERCVDRASMREFDNLVLFQMSAADSSLLIDSPAANMLGPHRAMLFSEERGTLEKFRPYAVPDADLNKRLLENTQRKWSSA